MLKPLTTKEFIKKAQELHGDRYDYSKVKYVRSFIPVVVVCTEHGEFRVKPNSHISARSGCPACAVDRLTNAKRKTTAQFVEDAREVHGDKYDYSRTKYVRAGDKVTIGCPKHGWFEQKPNSHLSGKGCYACGRSAANKANSAGIDAFLRRAKEEHGSKYDYSKVKYKNALTRVEIICPDHGSFWQTPGVHLAGSGCSVCSGRGMTTSEFVKRAREVHGDKYDYSRTKVKYANQHVKIVCPKHGLFHQTPSSHMRCGCQRCGRDVVAKQFAFSQAEWVKKAREIHGNKYDYSKTKYTRSAGKVTIGCPHHGFFDQVANSHLQGMGCFKCGAVDRAAQSRGRVHDREWTQNWMRSCFSYKDYEFPDGTVVKVQGYEPFALDLLMAEGLKRKDLSLGEKVPRISYTYDEAERSYFPDIYHVRSNTLIEVKSSWTWGKEKPKNVAKLNAARDAGYNVRLLVLSETGEVMLDRYKEARE